jgi:hypothetical protein
MPLSTGIFRLFRGANAKRVKVVAIQPSRSATSISISATASALNRK